MYATAAVIEKTPPSAASGRAVPGQDFLSALSAAYRAATSPVVSILEEQPAAGDISPMERYLAVTGRNIIENDPDPVVQDVQNAQDRWKDETLAHFTVGLFTGSWDDPIDTSRIINWQSAGDHGLTSEEVAQLKEKYNVDHLSAQGYYDLMSDLTHMEVLSGSDVMGVHLSAADGEPGSGATGLFTGAAGTVEGRFHGNIVNYFTVAVTRLLESWKWINSSEYKATNSHVSAEKQKFLLRATLKDLQPRQKMLDVLTQLQ